MTDADYWKARAELSESRLLGFQAPPPRAKPVERPGGLLVDQIVRHTLAIVGAHSLAVTVEGSELVRQALGPYYVAVASDLLWRIVGTGPGAGDPFFHRVTSLMEVVRTAVCSASEELRDAEWFVDRRLLRVHLRLVLVRGCPVSYALRIDPLPEGDRDQEYERAREAQRGWKSA